MTSEKCCFVLKLETGCLLLGVTTIVVSLIEIIITGVFVLPAHIETLESPLANATTSNVSSTYHSHHKHILDLVSDKPVKTVVVGFILIICLLWIMISVLLIIGIVKKKASFVMTYFLYGIAMSIMYLLSGIFQAIGGFWITSLFTIILSLIYIKCLISVYATYDKMGQLKTVGDMDQLVTDDEFMSAY